MSISPLAPLDWNIGDALGYGWARWLGDRGGYTRGVLVLALGTAVAGGLAAVLQVSFVDRSTGLGLSVLVGAVGLALVVVATQVLSAGFLRGVLGVTEGRPFGAGDMHGTGAVGPVLVTSLLVGTGTLLGSLLCYLPGLAVAFVTQWSLYFVIDLGLAPLEAIRASASLVRTRLTESMIWFLVSWLVIAAGAAFFVVGVVVALPVVLLGGAYTYRTFTGHPVVDQ